MFIERLPFYVTLAAKLKGIVWDQFDSDSLWPGDRIVWSSVHDINRFQTEIVSYTQKTSREKVPNESQQSTEWYKLYPLY